MNSETEILTLQARAFTAWRENNVKVFVNKYICEPWAADFSAWLIYQITKNNLFSAIVDSVAEILPALKTNSVGVSARFRSNSEWTKIFENSCFGVENELRSESQSSFFAEEATPDQRNPTRHFRACFSIR